MSVVNRSVFSFTLLAVGLSASLGSNCGELPLPISENEGPQFRLDGETEFVEFDVTMTADVSDLPLEVDRYSHALFDLVPGVDSDGLARVRVYDRWHQVLLDQGLPSRMDAPSTDSSWRTQRLPRGWNL